MTDASAGCALSAMGMVNALGRGADEIWPRLLAGDQSHFCVREDLVPGRSLLVAEVSGSLPPVPKGLSAYACRNNSLLLAALEQIETEISEARRAFGSGRLGVVIGTSTCGVSDAEAAIREQLETGRLAPAFDYAQLEFGGAASFVAELFGISGPVYTISTACSSGARALVSARSLLALGVCDAVVCGAADSLCGLTTNGFSRLQVISDRITNPCSVNRDGLTLGEGSVAFLATRANGGVQLRGIGESSEAHHMSAPDPKGAGAEWAMRQALLDADLEPEEIAYLNLHGTGTPLNDAMECPAVVRAFGSPPPSSSTKPLVGHTLGAAGGMEAGFCWLMLGNTRGGELLLPPHCYDGQVDAALAEVPLASKGMRARVAPVMTNSFGFGGNNCTLVLAPGAS
ncbi:MAG: beta-ketoacyl-[acyl-carrier-protein] synthase II [Planctomycetes bacterium]|jgi:3-oxoacyl-[acyl-carrier-protein] synthase-1|nr:beta-ketoacyl-[acyl-carrier-protein] synthase II [Planctomycetota bacterium]MBT39831.1 beta-ketoacyl-[acyl-carrier-protein] synthase II [Deltaproteobacteria bacterium]MCP4241087.1 beta-ketoacyl-ACP synthase [bacterium]MDP6076386.1 beta-ketoacyl-ACP synthase [Myxococcota bacterium]MDP6242114.1 beta-ketoacyl-ACP synthase [Myxococcota bacterium]